MNKVTTCRNCQRYTAIITEADGHKWQHDFEADGFTPSAQRHTCGESDRRAY